MKKIGIIGLGNILRQDDGIGIILLKKLKQKKELLPKNIELIEAGIPSVNLLHMLHPFEKVIFIDAVNLKTKPGTTKFFKTSDVISKKENRQSVSVHETDVLKIIEIHKKLDKDSKEFFIFGVQPKNTEYGENLSTDLKNNFEKTLKKLINKINQIA